MHDQTVAMLTRRFLFHATPYLLTEDWRIRRRNGCTRLWRMSFHETSSITFRASKAFLTCRCFRGSRCHDSSRTIPSHAGTWCTLSFFVSLESLACPCLTRNRCKTSSRVVIRSSCVEHAAVACFDGRGRSFRECHARNACETVRFTKKTLEKGEKTSQLHAKRHTRWATFRRFAREI